MFVLLFFAIFAYAEFEPDSWVGCRTLLSNATPGTLKAATVLQFSNNTTRIFDAITERQIVLKFEDQNQALKDI